MMLNMAWRTTLTRSVVFLFLFVTLGFAQGISNESLTENPNVLYDQGKYSDALRALQKAGINAASDHYNAGNIYYRLGHLGLALAHYEKANALAPTHADIRFNIKVTRDLLRKTGLAPNETSLWIDRVVPFAKERSEVWVTGPLAVCMLLLAYAFFRRDIHRSLMAIGLAGVFTFTLVAGLFFSARATDLAVVIGEAAVARSGPNDTFTELAKLPPATRVILLDEKKDGWTQIKFSSGKLAWVPDKDLLIL